MIGSALGGFQCGVVYGLASGVSDEDFLYLTLLYSLPGVRYLGWGSEFWG